MIVDTIPENTMFYIMPPAEKAEDPKGNEIVRFMIEELNSTVVYMARKDANILQHILNVYRKFAWLYKLLGIKTKAKTKTTMMTINHYKGDTE